MLPPTVNLDGLVVDAGANAGDFTAAVRRLEPRSRVVAFEPDPAPRGELEARFADDRQVTISPDGLSDRVGTATFAVAEHSVFSSLLTPQESIASIYPGSKIVGQTEIRTTTLDTAITEPVRVLKIDVQGNEVPLLQGAVGTLQRTEAVLIEVNFISHYEGDATFANIDEYMRNSGFALRALGDLYQPQERLLWADACYVPVGAS